MDPVRPDIVQIPSSIPVQFACTCGMLRPISRIYFCRHCLKLRCGFCVCHEIDSIYCANCVENMPSQEARLKKNKCTSCFECPTCRHTLSIRATPAPQRNPEDKKAPRKVYYLACLSCRWTSRDVGIPDQSVASGSWPERENVHAHRITAIQEMYKNLVLREKHEKQDKNRKKMYSQRGKYTSLTDKTGITAAIARKRAGLPEIQMPSIKPNLKQLEPAVAKEEVEALPNDIFSKEVNLNKITTITQRLLQPEWQPVTVDKMFPVRKALLIKRSQRCRTCEHNVSKPEYNPSSTKFKIQLLACYHVPDVRLVTAEPLRAGRQCEMIIKLINPTQHQTTVSFLPLPTEEEELVEIQEKISEEREAAERRDEPKSLGTRESFMPSLSKQVSLPEDPRPVDKKINTLIALPVSSVILPPRDDAAEYDDTSDVPNFEDDPKVVLFRKYNKVAIKLQITPQETLNIGDSVVVGFTMQHTYINTITTLENKEPKKIENKVKIYITVGKLVGSE